MKEVTIYWLTNSLPVKENIMKRFGLTHPCETVNGESVIKISNDKDMDDLLKVTREPYKYIQIRNK